MAFLTLTTKDVKEFTDSGSGGACINNTGIYPILIKWVEVETKNVDGKQIQSLNIRYQREDTKGEGYLFNIRLQKNNGEEHFQMNLIRNLMYLCKLKEIKDPVSTTVKLKNSSKEVMVLTDFCDKKVNVFCVAEYSRYNNKVYKKIIPYQFYDMVNNATAYELASKDESKYGFRYSLDVKKDSPDLRDGVSLDDVKDYENQFRNQTSTTNTPTQVVVEDDEIPF